MKQLKEILIRLTIWFFYPLSVWALIIWLLGLLI